MGGAVFFYRPPVVLVTDRAYDQLYGRLRGMKTQAEASLRLFRRVKTVVIAENAGTDVAVFAVGSASKKPFCVLFPYRYYREAEQYVQDYPGIPAAVLMGHIRESPADMSLPAIRTDTEEDYFKMGRAAAAFAWDQNSGNGADGEPQRPGEILFLRDDKVSSQDWEAFNRGLKAGEYPLAPLSVRAGDEYPVSATVVCAVLTGAAEFFLGQNLKFPIILVSWLDPSVTNSMVKIVFDDSPWAQVVPAAMMAAGEHEAGAVPSKILVLDWRIPEKEFVRQIRRIVQK
ncbi:MAG: hypothetical protein LBP81_04755 [Treponema sp.]|nr:hypothetical protein [Treponema sp.]